MKETPPRWRLGWTVEEATPKKPSSPNSAGSSKNAVSRVGAVLDGESGIRTDVGAQGFRVVHKKA